MVYSGKSCLDRTLVLHSTMYFDIPFKSRDKLCSGWVHGGNTQQGLIHGFPGSCRMMVLLTDVNSDMNLTAIDQPKEVLSIPIFSMIPVRSIGIFVGCQNSLSLSRVKSLSSCLLLI